jgi:hypothetical protein
MNFENWMGITGNVLDYSFDAAGQIPEITVVFANYCVIAAQIDPIYCPLASLSLEALDPVSDVVNRINYIFSNLSLVVGYPNPNPHASIGNFTFIHLASLNPLYFWAPESYVPWAQILLEVEKAIHGGLVTSNPSTKRSQFSEILFSSLPTNSLLDGGFNDFTGLGVSCLDGSLSGIEDFTTFLNYLSNQIIENPLLAIHGYGYSGCLTWPNLNSSDIERVRSAFPSTLNNKMLLVAGTLDPDNYFAGALATYQYIGADNANILVHDGVGHCSFSDPNPCTTTTIKEYLNNGSNSFLSTDAES